ncbi:hypothetical protein SAMN05216516_12110 [Izhakiella capsodis]|uniref:Uncharacterized protein n=1 Tax=Izhakiella capsodis TaxID=1367852 RepID=A0A1I5BT19_9GAMM|nr:hypothetical protein SAMN05216516_12110 [Izhakiella capsodis]
MNFFRISALFFNYASYPFGFLCLAIQMTGLILAYPFAWVSDMLEKISFRLKYKSISGKRDGKS